MKIITLLHSGRELCYDEAKEGVYMTVVRKFRSAEELRALRRMACSVPEEVMLREVDGDVRADAKSLISLFALDYSRPVCVVTESLELISRLEGLEEEARCASF